MEWNLQPDQKGMEPPTRLEKHGREPPTRLERHEREPPNRLERHRREPTIRLEIMGGNLQSNYKSMEENLQRD